MKGVISLALVVCLLIASAPAPAAAEEVSVWFPSCGPVQSRNTSHQFGSFNYIEYIVETVGVFDICGRWMVLVEASMPGIANSGLSSAGFMYAVARRQIPVPAYGRQYQTNGKHYVSGSIPSFSDGGWYLVGDTASFAVANAPQATSDPALDCFNNDGVWRDTWCDFKPSSPIIVDSARNGYALTSVSNGVRFDLDVDGLAELVAWTDVNSDDEFLVMDRNGNGVIDDGSEMFGDHTPAYPFGAPVTTANGFEALKFLESPSWGASRTDGAVGIGDAPFARLQLWRDANHNGLSEPEELRSAAGAGVQGISTDYKEKKRRDRFGNEFRQRGTIFWTDGHDFVYDIWLQSRD